MLQLAVGAIIVGTIAVVGISHHVGNQVRIGFYEAAREMHHPFMQVQVANYQRTFLGAKAQTVWTLRDAEDESLQFTLDHTISHGPWTLQDAARIVSHLVLPPGTDPALSNALGGASPVEWTANIGWGGQSEHALTAPAWKARFKDGSDVNWGGLQSQWQLSADYKTLAGHFQMPHLNVEQPGMTKVDLQGIEMRYDGQQAPGYLFWTGPFEMKVSNLQLSSNLMAWTMQGLDIRSTTEMQRQLVRSDLHAKIRQMQLTTPATHTARDLEFHVDMDRIPAKLLDQFIAMSQQGMTAEHRAQWQARLPELLQAKPQMQLRTLRFTTDEGTSELKAKVHYQGEGQPGGNPAQDLDASIQLSLPQALLDGYLPATQLHQMTSQGLLQTQDGQYNAQLQFQQGQLLLNQRPLPLPMLMALSSLMM